jgi:hypothetical protein
MVDPAKGNSTPPAELPARKIMRRDDGKSGTNTTANSQTPSKSTSEMGGSDGSNDGNEGKDKAALTREEREARYRAARQRIFGSAESEENEAAEVTGSGDDKDKVKDVSRTSSASGKKKSKKQRNYDDDDFQARSHFNAYYPHQYSGPGYTADNVVYYNGFPVPPNPQYATMNPGASPPPIYSNPYPVMMPQEAQSQYGWTGQQYQSPNGSMMYPGYGHVQNGYDLSADFQRGMASFQKAGIPSQVTPKMANPQMAPYQDPYQQPQHMSLNSAWPQMSQQPTYPMGQAPYPQAGPTSGSGPYPQQAQMLGSSPYGQFPSNPYSGKSGRNQHPIPGSYTRPQFNPQTQSFIPGGMPTRTPPYMGQAPPQMNGYGNFQQPYPSFHPSSQMSKHSPSSTSTPSFGSPQSLQGNNNGTSMSRIASQSGEPGSLQSSIAKYGTPAHLPPKPPAPAPSQHSAPKFMLPSMTRAPSNTMPSAPVNTVPAVTVRGGAGSTFNNTTSN